MFNNEDLDYGDVLIYNEATDTFLVEDSEGFGAKIKKLWDKLIAFFKKIWNSIKNAFNKIFGKVSKRNKTISSVLSKAKEKIKKSDKGFIMVKDNSVIEYSEFVPGILKQFDAVILSQIKDIESGNKNSKVYQDSREMAANHGMYFGDTSGLGPIDKTAVDSIDKLIAFEISKLTIGEIMDGLNRMMQSYEFNKVDTEFPADIDTINMLEKEYDGYSKEIDRLNKELTKSIDNIYKDISKTLEDLKNNKVTPQFYKAIGKDESRSEDLIGSLNISISESKKVNETIIKFLVDISNIYNKKIVEFVTAVAEA